MAPVTRGKGKPARPGPSDLSQVPRPPRLKLVMGTGKARKRDLPAPEQTELETEERDLTLSVSDTGPKSKKSKKNIPSVQFLLTCVVAFEKKLLVNETELKTPGAFNYPEFASLEAKSVGLYAMRKKLNLERVRGRAAIRYGVEAQQGISGKSGIAKTSKEAGGMVTRSVDDPEDWEKTEAMAIDWALGGKKGVKVELRVEYRVPLDEGEESDDSGDPYSEEAKPSTDTLPQRKLRRTATVIMREEMEKQQREETCYIPDLMRRWRCQNKGCKQFPDNACLVLAHEKQCRPLNAHILGIWDGKIKRGECTEHSFPLDVKMPPLATDKAAKPTAPISVSQAPPMQISVTAPPPQIPPWWLPTSTSLQSQFPLPVHQFSSPIWSHGMSSTELLGSFMEWFKSTLTPGNDVVFDAVEEAFIALKREMYDLEGLRTMDVLGWKELKVPIGLGNRMGKAVKEFKKLKHL